MNDSEFLKAFEDCTLHPFPHRSHIRMAWLYLRAYGWDAGAQKIRRGIQRYAKSVGATSKYHETITIFWANLVYYVVQCYPDVVDFETFLALHPGLLDTSLIARHYSQAVLYSDTARYQWVEPDLQPMPH
jgi:hypothetical protein